MQSEIILSTTNITKSFYNVRALDEVNFEVKRGHVHALCGENGAGKSTLLKIITGLYTKDSGDIYVNGEKVDIRDIPSARKHGIYVVPQEMQILRDLTVAENIFLGQYPLTPLGTVDWSEVYRKAEALKAQLGADVVDFNMRSKAGALGMGAWQLIEIMRALVSENVLVIAFDEPTSSLSERETNLLFRIIEDLKKRGITVIYVSHRLVEIFQICDVVTVLKDGRYIGTVEVAATTRDELVSMMIGRELNLFGNRRTRSDPEEVALKVSDFSDGKHYHDIKLELRRGEILGFYGLVGSGRTEFARGLFGIDKKKEGEVWKNGKPIRIHSPKDAIRRGLGFVTENRREEGLMLSAPLSWNVSITNFETIQNQLRLLDLKKEKAYAEKALSLFNVRSAGISALAKSLSGGNQQKVVLSKWVMSDCDVIIVDEPTRGVDVGAKQEVYEQLKSLADAGKSILLISSELPEVLGICDRILVMCEGHIAADLVNNNLGEDDIIKFAFPA